MIPAGLQLDYYFFPLSHISAHPGGADLSGLPKVGVTIYVPSSEVMWANMDVSWGDIDKTQYKIEIMVHAAFKIPPAPNNVDAKNHLRKTLLNVSMNGAQMLYSATREHVTAITARGPHGPVFLPAVVIEESDVAVNLSPEMESFLGMTPEQNGRSKEK